MEINKEKFIENFYKTKNNKELAIIYNLSVQRITKLTKSLGLKRKPGRKIDNIVWV